MNLNAVGINVRILVDKWLLVKDHIFTIHAVIIQTCQVPIYQEKKPETASQKIVRYLIKKLNLIK